MACPKCGHEINHEQFPLGLTFCPYCGDKVSGQDPAQSIAFCPYCGRRILIAATFCPECGKRIATGTQSHYAVTGATAPAIPSPPPPQFSVTPPQRVVPPPEIDDALQMSYEEPLSPPPSQPIWPRIVAFCRRALQPVGTLITGRWRLKRLYKDWSVHDALPSDEIPSDDYLNNMSRQGSPPTQGVPQWLIVLLIVMVIVIFIVVGILLWRI